MKYCDCELYVPHAVGYHDKVVKALADNPNQHFIIEAGIPYLVEAEDLIGELNDVSE